MFIIALRSLLVCTKKGRQNVLLGKFSDLLFHCCFISYSRFCPCIKEHRDVEKNSLPRTKKNPHSNLLTINDLLELCLFFLSMQKHRNILHYSIYFICACVGWQIKVKNFCLLANDNLMDEENFIYKKWEKNS
jgi:hypothetical protein